MKNNLSKFRRIKAVEICIFVIFELAFLCILIANKTMRTSIFVDRSLFILCAITYITVVFSFAAIIIDILTIRKLKVDNRELENIAYVDTKTGIPNRTSCDLLFQKYSTSESMKGIACIVTKITNIREINLQKGKDYGDKVIVDYSRILEKCAANYGFVGRNGGNEFITVIENCDMEKIRSFISVLYDNVEEYNSNLININLELRSEYALFDYEDVDSFSGLIAKAYAKFN